MAGIDRGTHCDWLKDPEYKAQFEAARVQAADMLEDGRLSGPRLADPTCC